MSPNGTVQARPRGRLSAREHLKRSASIAASRARGRTWPEIALEHGVSLRQVQRVAAEWEREKHDIEGVDPFAEIRSTLALLRQVVADMAKIEESADNHAAHIGASRLKVETTMRRLELMFSLGLVKSPAIVDLEKQTAEVFQELAYLAQHHNVSDDFLTDVLDLSTRNSAAQRSPLELGVGA